MKKSLINCENSNNYFLYQRKKCNPTLGNPTTPALRLFEGRPSKGFSFSACFFGGMVQKWDFD